MMRRISHTYVALAVLSMLVQASVVARGAGQISSVTFSNEVAHVQFESVPGESYTLQKLDSIADRWWDDTGTSVVATATTTQISVTNAAANNFFRVLEFTNSVIWYDWGYKYQAAAFAEWGFGSVEESYYHLDRPYDWYIDQADTGAASDGNCGPSSVAMAIKWYDSTFAGTAEEARDWSYSWRTNGWWYTSDIESYLTLHSVPWIQSAYDSQAQMQGLVQDGNILILCINTTYLVRNLTAEERIGRSYSFAGGHFIVVKGARTVDGTILFESYDPNNWDASYSGGTPKCRNRHYTGSQLATAITNHWANLIVVAPPAGGGGEAPEAAEAGGGGGDIVLAKASKKKPSKWLRPVDPSKIKHARSGPKQRKQRKKRDDAPISSAPLLFLR